MSPPSFSPQNSSIRRCILEWRHQRCYFKMSLGEWINQFNCYPRASQEACWLLLVGVVWAYLNLCSKGWWMRHWDEQVNFGTFLTVWKPVAVVMPVGNSRLWSGQPNDRLTSFSPPTALLELIIIIMIFVCLGWAARMNLDLRRRRYPLNFMVVNFVLHVIILHFGIPFLQRNITVWSTYLTVSRVDHR